MDTPHRILCPTDFSECATDAARYAVDLAARLGARVTLLHVYMAPVYALPDGSSFIPGPQTLAELESGARRGLEALRAQLARPEVEIDVDTADGPTAEMIATTALDEKYDLIVMGTHGRTGLRHLLLGSVAEKVVRTAACPVLTVRAAAQPEAQPQP
jgi:nucleotide-binding universal stress UspA family protein